MSILQMYYTSFVNKETGSAGFQIKAMSPGITPDLRATILRLIAYRIPPSCDERKPELHPIALRYFYKNSQECILVCSQSNGPDEYGRPGNFFAHALVMEPNNLTSIPPVLYWKSDIWCKDANETSSEVHSWSSLDMDLNLDIEDVWTFLSSPIRRVQFYQLMCAVLHIHKTHRSIVIIDTADNVALWIAAVSCMLPPEYRPLLSFATYHHDPYQAPFLITGTTSDSFFRALPEEYMTYFILNAEAGKISEVEDSVYADRVAQYAHPDFYETHLLPLFSKYAQRFPPSTEGIDERLDSMVRYADVLTSAKSVEFTAEVEQAIESAVLIFEQRLSCTTDDLNELLQLRQILWAALKSRRKQTLFKLYMRVATLVEQHGQSTEEIVLQELKFFTECLSDSVTELSQLAPTMEGLRKLYRDEMLVICINDPDYLHYLDNLLDQPTVHQLCQIWQQLGSYVQPSPHSKNLLQKSIRLLSELHSNKNFDEENKLSIVIRRAIAEQEEHWFPYAIEDKLPKNALIFFYCWYVYPLNFDQRLSYRHMIQQVVPDIITDELAFDIDQEGPKNGLRVLERWSKHLKRYPHLPPLLLFSYGLSRLEKQCSIQERYTLSKQILLSNTLNPLPSEIEKKLIASVFSAPSLSTFSRDKIELYKRYHDHQLLSKEVRTVIDASLAMFSGQLDADLAQRLHEYLDSLSPEKYLAEIGRFIGEFFTFGISNEVHSHMISALFIPKFQKYFWMVYWGNWSEIFTYPQQVQRGIDLLSFWFSLLPERDLSLWHQYIVQNFFLKLPLQLGQLQNTQGFKVLASTINDTTKSRPWYSSIRPLLSNRKHAPFSRLIPRFSKKQNTNETLQMSKRKVEEEVAKLFEDEYVELQHIKGISLFYAYQQHEQFWTSYRAKLIEMLTRQRDKDSTLRDAHIVLKLLSFWFDGSFISLGEAPFAMQDFFLGLEQVLYEARKTRGFRELASAINELSAKQREQYQWYRFVANYFMFVQSNPYEQLN